MTEEQLKKIEDDYKRCFSKGYKEIHILIAEIRRLAGYKV